MASPLDLDTSAITSSAAQVANQVLAESDITKTEDLIKVFNWHMAKRSVARTFKLNELYDSVTDQIATRVLTKPDQFSNSDLLDYMKVIQGAIDHSDKARAGMEQPPLIQQNNTQIINVIDNQSTPLTQDSRRRILAAIQATLDAAAIETTDFIDTTEDKNP